MNDIQNIHFGAPPKKRIKIDPLIEENKAYFFQTMEQDKDLKDKAVKMLVWPDIHSHILTFIPSLKNLRLISKAIKEFIDAITERDFSIVFLDFINKSIDTDERNLSIQLRYLNYINHFIAYLKNDSNIKLLEKLNALSLEIGGWSLYNTAEVGQPPKLITTFKKDFAELIKEALEKLIAQLEQLPKLNLHLKLRLGYDQVDSFIDSLANRVLPNLKSLDFRMTQLGVEGAKKLADGIKRGNLQLDELMLNDCDRGVAIIANNKNSKTKLCLETRYLNGDTYFGEYQNFERHEYGTTNYTCERHGYGTYIYAADGRRYKGQWRDNKRHGHGTFTYADGTTYVGEFKDGKGHGQGTYTFANGDTYTGEWQENLAKGLT